MAYSSARPSYVKKSWAKPAIVKEPRAIKQWSQYQKAIFNEIANGSGNLHIEAFAGAAKTSTLCEGFYYVPKGKSCLMCAFNKSIQVELEKRATDTVSVKTLHSIGYAACRKAFPRIGQPDNKKLEGYIKAERGDEPETFEVRGNLAKAVSLCKGYLAESYDEIDQIMDKHDVDTCDDSRENFIASVIKIMQACKADTSRIDFDDMIWLPNVLNLKLDKYDFVFIDEAQDLNIAQINLALNSCTKTGRIISCGDRNQAIYGFRGADSNAIQNIIDRCNSKVLPLSVTYRCAKSIVELAKTIVPEIEHAPNAVEGSVSNIGENQLENLIKPGDFLISRINAPLLKWCLQLLKANTPANILVRDLGKTLLSMIKKSGAKDVESFLSWLDKWRDVEVERLVKAKRDSSVIEDKVECFRVLCEGTKSLSDVKDNIERLFYDGDDKNRVLLSSTHKIKGMEADNVFMLSSTYRPNKGKEEANLYYVGVSRAKTNLYMVS